MKISAKLLGSSFVSFLFLASISVYIVFQIGKLGDMAYNTLIVKDAISDINFYSANTINALALYLISEPEKRAEIWSEYNRYMDRFRSSIEILKKSGKLAAYIPKIESDHQAAMAEAEKMINLLFNVRFQKEERLKNTITNLRENRHKVMDNTAKGSDKLKLAIAQMSYKDKEFVFQYQDQQHATEWLESIDAVKTIIEKEKLNSALPFLSDYLNAAQKAVDETNAINALKSEEQISLDRIETTIGNISGSSAEMNKIAEQDLDKILNQNKNRRAFLGIILLFAFLFSAFLVLDISKKITDSIEDLTYTASKISGGDTSRRVKINSKDEVGLLASSFNRMVDNLEKNRNKLRVNKIELEKKVDELEKWRKFTTEREIKMVQLKKRIEELEGKAKK